MKTLLPLFLVPLSFLLSSVSPAQTNCTKYFGGEISCTGPGGYQLEAREHLNGQTSYYDSKGNIGTVNQHPNGGVSITPTQIGRSAPPPSGAGLSLSRAGNGLESISPQLNTSPSTNRALVHENAEPVSDYSSLPKTPEEYRLSVLWMKAVNEKDFEKAQELKQLLMEEQFTNASAADKVRMFNEAEAAARLEMMESVDRVEKRLKWENRPGWRATFDKVKEMRLTTHEETWGKLGKAFKEKLVEWEEEDELKARLAKLAADLASLEALKLDAVEYKKKEDELLEQWGKAEDEQKRRKSAIIDAEIGHMMAEENTQRKIKTRK